MKLPMLKYLAILLVLFSSCGGNKKDSAKSEANEAAQSGFIYLSPNQLNKLGIFIQDSSVMYNNEIKDVGELNITIRGMGYIGNAATTEQTNLNFYPRYITTLDTVQRAMYRLEGEYPNDMEEARKWSSFESLIPVVVEQKSGDVVFGETLVFWLTKTPDLERMIKEIRNENQQ